MTRFDKAAEFLARHFGFEEQQARFRDRVRVRENFQDEVHSSGREGERRSLRIENHRMFFNMTVGQGVTVAEIGELLWAVERALNRA